MMERWTAAPPLEVLHAEVFELQELEQLVQQHRRWEQHEEEAEGGQGEEEDGERKGEGQQEVRHQQLLGRFMKALGPQGPGLVAVRGLPGLPSLRQDLLPIARALALSPPSARSAFLKAHKLGTDVPLKDPNRAVSSFAAQLKFEQGKILNSQLSASSSDTERVITCRVQKPARGSEILHSLEGDTAGDYLTSSLANDKKIHQLGELFRLLGEHMVKVGLLVARVCDLSIQNAGLEQAILAASTAKGRLIHYHALHDSLILLRRGGTGSNKTKAKDLKKAGTADIDNRGTELWQQWHYDYGIITVLTVPMFLSTRSKPPFADQCLQINDINSSVYMHNEESELCFEHIGLKILDPGSGRVEFINVPADCLIIQVGEAAQIMTGGKLRATAHCVCRPSERDDISRETYVVFLQPSWQQVLTSPDWDATVSCCSCALDSLEDGMSRSTQEIKEIQNKIPTLKSRWRDGCTFADFSRETTKQYYGTNGYQSHKHDLQH